MIAWAKELNEKGNLMRNIVFLLLTFFFASVCHAERYESSDNFKTTAKDFVLKNTPVDPGDSIEVQATMPDRLLVPMCSKAIEASFPRDAIRENLTSVEMTCDGASPWHVFIPVTITMYSQLVVAKHVLTSKTAITEDDITIARVDKSHLYNGYFKTKDEVIGMEASQLISSGAVLSKQNLQFPVLVHRNQMIDLIATRNSIVVTAKGIAKSDGKLNESIKAYNPSSKRTLDAVVVGSSKAEVI
jgi:flagella basal body P-ring formation protein FlgA